MRIIYTILGSILFVLLIGFALKNAYPVKLYYYLGLSWQAPLSLVVFMSLMTGIVAGLIAISPTLIKQRRELNKFIKENPISFSKNQGAE
jgi:lipopolysaccharide assembly protein A